MRKNVLITGASGQDAHYISKICFERGDHIVGITRPTSDEGFERKLFKYFHQAHQVDLRNRGGLLRVLRLEKWDEVYHLAAHHGSSEQDACASMTEAVRGVSGTQALLEGLHATKHTTRVLLAGSCRQFGINESSRGGRLHEKSTMHPDEPYAWGKWAAMQLGHMYRESGALEVCTAILFNHESSLRPASYISQKLATAAAEAKHHYHRYGRIYTEVVRDLNACADWGAAEDYARAMTMMLGAKKLDDYIVATGVTHSVHEMARAAFDAVGLDWRKHVYQIDDPQPGRMYIGNPARIRNELGWKPEISFEQMMCKMVEAAESVHLEKSC